MEPLDHVPDGADNCRILPLISRILTVNVGTIHLLCLLVIDRILALLCILTLNIGIIDVFCSLVIDRILADVLWILTAYVGPHDHAS